MDYVAIFIFHGRYFCVSVTHNNCMSTAFNDSPECLNFRSYGNRHFHGNLFGTGGYNSKRTGGYKGEGGRKIGFFMPTYFMDVPKAILVN